MSYDISINYMTEVSEPEAMWYHVHVGYVSLLTLSVLRDNDAIVSTGQALLHRRACKRWLYLACATPRRFVVLVKIF